MIVLEGLDNWSGVWGVHIYCGYIEIISGERCQPQASTVTSYSEPYQNIPTPEIKHGWLPWVSLRVEGYCIPFFPTSPTGKPGFSQHSVAKGAHASDVTSSFDAFVGFRGNAYFVKAYNANTSRTLLKPCSHQSPRLHV